MSDFKKKFPHFMRRVESCLSAAPKENIFIPRESDSEAVKASAHLAALLGRDELISKRARFAQAIIRLHNYMSEEQAEWFDMMCKEQHISLDEKLTRRKALELLDACKKEGKFVMEGGSIPLG